MQFGIELLVEVIYFNYCKMLIAPLNYESSRRLSVVVRV